jgi:3',5'-cyclic AMP phosphodiesterase CpdA
VDGDLAYQKGLAPDYQRFGSLIETVRAAAPIHLSLGNHDDRQNFWSAFPQDAPPHSQQLHRQATVFSTARANWFLVDSLDLTNHTPGEIGVVQRDWLARELEQRPDRPAIVVGHHNLQFDGDKLIGLRDSGEFADLLARHPQVKAFVFGHTHDWHVETHPSGVHLINLPPTAYVFQAGRPSGWVWATLHRDGAEFELRSLDKQHPEHGQVKQLTWRTA